LNVLLTTSEREPSRTPLRFDPSEQCQSAIVERTQRGTRRWRRGLLPRRAPAWREPSSVGEYRVPDQPGCLHPAVRGTPSADSCGSSSLLTDRTPRTAAVVASTSSDSLARMGPRSVTAPSMAVTSMARACEQTRPSLARTRSTSATWRIARPGLSPRHSNR
jgi:hypothetical protein